MTNKKTQLKSWNYNDKALTAKRNVNKASDKFWLPKEILKLLPLMLLPSVLFLTWDTNIVGMRSYYAGNPEKPLNTWLVLLLFLATLALLIARRRTKNQTKSLIIGLTLVLLELLTLYWLFIMLLTNSG